MEELLEKLFSSDFMPHGYCYLWKPGLVWLHVVSDALIALAYFSIPVTLIYFIRKRRDLPFNWMFVSFGTFILACGATHTMEVWTLWHGTYWLSGAIKVVTAMASVPTAILLVRLVPQALALPSPEAMKLEIAERKRTEQALHQANSELELKVLERTAELRESEGELRQLIDVIPQQVFVFDSGWSPLFANRRDLEYTGLTLQEAQSKDAVARIFHPEDLKKEEAICERARSEGTPFEFEARIRGKDGQYRWFLIRDNPLLDEQGRILRWYGTRTDIEERKRTEEALRKSELAKRTADLAAASERLRNEQIKRAGAEEAARAGEERFQVIADSLPEPLTDIASDQRYRFTNVAFEEWFGWSSEQAKGRSVREVMGEEIYGTIQSYVEKALRGQSASFEGHLSFEKTGLRYVHIDFVPRRDRGSEVYGFYSVLRDLTQLKEAEEKFRRVVETAPDAIVLVNPEGRIVMTNPRAEHMFRYAQQELIGQPVEILVPDRFRRGHAANRSAYLRKPVIRFMGAGQELCVVRKDGSEFPVEISLSPIETVDGTLVSSTIHDITERKQLEQQARRSTILEERSRMARDVHDTMAQGFTGIVLNLEAAEEASADLPEEVRNRITRARDVARQSLEEVRRSVLMLSASPAVRGNLAGAIRDSVDRVRSNTGIRVGFSVRGTPQHLDVRFEENLLRIAQQALDNALQHAQAKGIRIELVFGKKEVRLQIVDNGQGFIISKRPGRGMGINGMCDRAEEIGGKCEIKSQPGRGTRITVTVPLPSTGRPRVRHEEEVRDILQ
jgi:PAS domain S-box-containing protein